MQHSEPADDAVAAVIAAEASLLDSDVRRERHRLEALLDESFVEIGQSGRLWRRAPH
ncbi:hypothetical protein [Subtercola lobariae]|uniref:DUF4440 domain-containing protein n=1 Tax=Subtercola lobariae TaxID=1588641 RepID=A0A917B3A6_9MICO|nr:hypothetical protein [Subtercola lobariae]GGF20694.1 hypothetical protein GCM10011399_12920 [Subtercola lobariae]